MHCYVSPASHLLDERMTGGNHAKIIDNKRSLSTLPKLPEPRRMLFGAHDGFTRMADQGTSRVSLLAATSPAWLRRARRYEIIKT